MSNVNKYDCFLSFENNFQFFVRNRILFYSWFKVRMKICKFYYTVASIEIHLLYSQSKPVVEEEWRLCDYFVCAPSSATRDQEIQVLFGKKGKKRKLSFLFRFTYSIMVKSHSFDPFWSLVAKRVIICFMADDNLKLNIRNEEIDE